jgi:hypothetical protein
MRSAYERYLIKRNAAIRRGKADCLSAYARCHWKCVLPFPRGIWHIFGDDPRNKATPRKSLASAARATRRSLAFSGKTEFATSHVWWVGAEASRNTYFACARPNGQNGLMLGTVSDAPGAKTRVELWHQIFLEVYQSVFGRDLTLNNRLRRMLEADRGLDWYHVGFEVVEGATHVNALRVTESQNALYVKLGKGFAHKLISGTVWQTIGESVANVVDEMAGNRNCLGATTCAARVLASVRHEVAGGPEISISDALRDCRCRALGELMRDCSAHAGRHRGCPAEPTVTTGPQALWVLYGRLWHGRKPAPGGDVSDPFDNVLRLLQGVICYARVVSGALDTRDAPLSIHSLVHSIRRGGRLQVLRGATVLGRYSSQREQEAVTHALGEWRGRGDPGLPGSRRPSQRRVAGTRAEKEKFCWTEVCGKLGDGFDEHGLSRAEFGRTYMQIAETALELANRSHEGNPIWFRWLVGPPGALEEVRILSEEFVDKRERMLKRGQSPTYVANYSIFQDPRVFAFIDSTASTNSRYRLSHVVQVPSVAVSHRFDPELPASEFTKNPRYPLVAVVARPDGLVRVYARGKMLLEGRRANHKYGVPSSPHRRGIAHFIRDAFKNDGEPVPGVTPIVDVLIEILNTKGQGLSVALGPDIVVLEKDGLLSTGLDPLETLSPTPLRLIDHRLILDFAKLDGCIFVDTEQGLLYPRVALPTAVTGKTLTDVERAQRDRKVMEKLREILAAKGIRHRSAVCYVISVLQSLRSSAARRQKHDEDLRGKARAVVVSSDNDLTMLKLERLQLRLVTREVGV